MTLKRNKVIIDTDPGYDDAMALLLAIFSQRLDILFVSTVAGNSFVENTTRNARYILNLVSSTIPIHSGLHKPLIRELDWAKVTGKSGLEGIEHNCTSRLTNDAVDTIINTINLYPDQVTLIALAPLTNIAQAIIREPQIMQRIKEIIIMGGAIKSPGNKNRVAEFNIYVDPEAADIVFKFPVKKTLVPLDACNQVWMELNDFLQIKNPFLEDFIIKIVKNYIKNISSKAGEKRALMYDPLTIYYYLFPENCTVAQYDVLIETKGEHTRGMTIAELRANAHTKPNVTVVESIPSREFISYFIETLSDYSHII